MDRLNRLCKLIIRVAKAEKNNSQNKK